MFFYIVFFLHFKYVCLHFNYPNTDTRIKKYVDSLNKVSNYYVKHLNQIDIAVLFGLFITAANFKYIINRPPRYISLANQHKIKHIIQTNGEIIKAFNEAPYKKFSSPYREISTLFDNITFWVSRLDHFKYTEQKTISKHDLDGIFIDWEKYKKVQGSDKGEPDQHTSNACLISLSKYPINTGDRILRCTLEKSCNVALNNGTNSGFPLSLRILWLVIARYGRGCHILSYEEDRKLNRQLCDMARVESQYNFHHDYEFADLMFEFICVCSLAGYAEHLHGPWLNAMLEFQTASGCFKGNAKENTTVCSNHISATSACTLSNALRYLLSV